LAAALVGIDLVRTSVQIDLVRADVGLTFEVELITE
jgi:hypothetical protein